VSLQLDGTVALVTGAGSGIGAATAERLASEGASVLMADLNREAVEAVASRIVQGGGDAVAVAVDVTDDADVSRMVATAVERWGRLDRAVNDAGIAQPAMRIDELSGCCLNVPVSAPDPPFSLTAVTRRTDCGAQAKRTAAFTLVVSRARRKSSGAAVSPITAPSTSGQRSWIACRSSTAWIQSRWLALVEPMMALL
jgi:NAD(P)-dependent dehydrogenase (short-subunit alcohol dehydrogenase family)